MGIRPALGTWKLLEVGAPIQAHRTCPGTTLSTRAQAPQIGTKDRMLSPRQVDGGSSHYL